MFENTTHRCLRLVQGVRQYSVVHLTSTDYKESIRHRFSRGYIRSVQVPEDTGSVDTSLLMYRLLGNRHLGHGLASGTPQQVHDSMGTRFYGTRFYGTRFHGTRFHGSGFAVQAKAPRYKEALV